MKNFITIGLAVLLFGGAIFAFSGSSGSGSQNTASVGSGPDPDNGRNGGSPGKIETEKNKNRDDSASASGAGGDDSRLRGGMTSGGRDGKSALNRSGDDEDNGGRMGRMREAVMKVGVGDTARLRKFAAQNNLTMLEAAKLAVNESRLECGDEESMMGRIRCRMNLTREEQSDGLYYFPEECRNLANGTRLTCLAKYHIVQPCRFESGDGRRFACVRERLNATKSAKELVEDCKERARGNNATNAANMTNATLASMRGIGQCVSEVRSRVFDVAKFKIYNLEEKAERLKGMGADANATAAFIAQLEGLKAKFNDAITADGKKAVLEEVKHAWAAFFENARAQIRQPKSRYGG